MDVASTVDHGQPPTHWIRPDAGVGNMGLAADPSDMGGSTADMGFFHPGAMEGQGGAMNGGYYASPAARAMHGYRAPASDYHGEYSNMG